VPKGTRHQGHTPPKELLASQLPPAATRHRHALCGAGAACSGGTRGTRDTPNPRSAVFTAATAATRHRPTPCRSQGCVLRGNQRHQGQNSLQEPLIPGQGQILALHPLLGSAAPPTVVGALLRTQGLQPRLATLAPRLKASHPQTMRVRPLASLRLAAVAHTPATGRPLSDNRCPKRTARPHTCVLPTCGGPAGARGPGRGALPSRRRHSCSGFLPESLQRSLLSDDGVVGRDDQLVAA
jgi:hypothetical protein